MTPRPESTWPQRPRSDKRGSRKAGRGVEVAIIDGGAHAQNAGGGERAQHRPDHVRLSTGGIVRPQCRGAPIEIRIVPRSMW